MITAPTKADGAAPLIAGLLRDEHHIDGETLDSLRSVQQTQKITLEEHTAIFEAVAARDPDAAARAMRAHLLRANKLYRLVEPSDDDD